MSSSTSRLTELLYLDNSATTRVSEEVALKMQEAMLRTWGNPSSLHTAGQEAAALCDRARSDVLRALGAPCTTMTDRRSLIFTASGSESNNLAILGCAAAKERNRRLRLIVSDSEHPSVLQCAEKLEKEGCDVYRLKTRDGVLHADDIAQALEKEPFLVSCMLVNNETGARYDVESLFAQAKAKYPKCTTHTDAVQGFLHVPLRVPSLGADLITVSGHKIHGPKGIGALYVSPAALRAKAISPVILGGGQENGFRSGTENVPGIVGIGAAASHCPDHGAQTAFREAVLQNLPQGVRANIPQGKTSPHILSLTLPDIRSETMLHFLNSRGIAVSSGSACSSHAAHGSYVLRAFGLSDSEADTTIRVSTDEGVTADDAVRFLAALREGVQELIRRH